MRVWSLAYTENDDAFTQFSTKLSLMKLPLTYIFQYKLRSFNFLISFWTVCLTSGAWRIKFLLNTLFIECFFRELQNYYTLILPAQVNLPVVYMSGQLKVHICLTLSCEVFTRFGNDCSLFDSYLTTSFCRLSPAQLDFWRSIIVLMLESSKQSRWTILLSIYCLAIQ